MPCLSTRHAVVGILRTLLPYLVCPATTGFFIATTGRSGCSVQVLLILWYVSVASQTVSMYLLTSLQRLNQHDGRILSIADLPVRNGLIPQPHFVLSGTSKMVYKVLAKDLSRNTVFPSEPLVRLLQTLRQPKPLI